MCMYWTCGVSWCELGLPTGKAVWSLYDLSNIFLDPSRPAFPYIPPCMGDLHYDPVSDESLALMKGWIDDCRHRHQLCMTPQPLHGPKRLLKCLSDGSVRLETQSGNQPCGGYITLSYCWGDGTAVMKTTMQTVELHHRQPIPNESLPPLFQEVVALARGFNTDLWIDSLCIIQDSQEDKEEEMKQMNDIFRAALAVVVAATASSPLDSLLRVKPQPGQTTTWRTASLIRYQEMDLDVKFRKRDWEVVLPHRSTDATYDTPIARRAWCFQEKLLASRCLVFQRNEVVWECRSCCLCECTGDQEHLEDRGFGMRPYKQMLLPLAEHDTLTAFAQLPFAEHEPFLDGTLTAFAQLPFAEHEPFDGPLKYFADAEAAYSFWIDAVENYSTRELSFKTDRLPAISAVASVIAEATGDDYLAGLWRKDLLGLRWLARDNFDSISAAPRPNQEYIAPTWSWASLPRAVWYPDRTRHSHDANLEASVLDAWTDVKQDGRSGRLYGPMSEVTDGVIVLSGVHCDAEMTISSQRGDIKLDLGNGEVETVCYDLTFISRSLDFNVEPDTNIDRPEGNSRYLRRVTDRRKTLWNPDCSGTVHLLWLTKNLSLILTPSHRRKGACERLGIFCPGIGTQTPEIPKTVQRSPITLV